LTIAELAAELGRRAKDYRLRRRLDQAQVAALAGVSERTLRFLEQGRGSSLDTLLRVMKALGTLDGLDHLFPALPSVDPLAVLKGETRPQRIYKKRSVRE
jgi:transcriptional regulator with XRE-family HTH domain